MKYSHLMCTQGISLAETLTEWAPFDPFDPKLYTLVVTNWNLHAFLDYYCPRTRFIIIPFDNGWPIHRTRKGMDGWISRKAQSNFGTSYCSCPVLTGSQQLTINVKLARLGNSEYQPAAVFGLTGVYLSWPRTDWTDWPEQSRSPPPPLCC